MAFSISFPAGRERSREDSAVRTASQPPEGETPGFPKGEERRRVHKIAQYAAAGTVHPKGGKDESSQSRTSASPCNFSCNRSSMAEIPGRRVRVLSAK